MTPRKEIAGSLALILFSAVFLVYTARYPLDDWENPGPAVFPLLLGGVLLLLSAWQLIRAFLAPRPLAEAGEARKETVASLLQFLRENRGEAKVVRLTAMLVLYVLLMQWIGFFVSSFLLALLSSRQTEAKDWGKPLLMSAGLSLFCYLLFDVWLKLSLPRGILF